MSRFSLMLTATSIAVALIASVSASTAQTAPAAFRDLNHDGVMQPYEDVRLSAETRVTDLIGRMTLEEKVGSMVHGTLPGAGGGGMGASPTGYDRAATERLIDGAKITSLLTRLSLPPQRLAEENNVVQQIAERGRLGIPVTISTDPRSHFQGVVGASITASGFSMWPETLGLGAIGDPATVRRFGQIVSAEYRAVGINMALSPQADLATEPRWSRGVGAFGSDPKSVSALVGAYIEGFQGSANGVTKNGVATIVKHWVGYGAQPGGFDGHNYYGRIARLNNATFDKHVAAFAGALKVKSAGVMPTYPILEGVSLDGKPLEAVGTGFSKQLIDDLLRKKLGFGGMIISDWGIASDCPQTCVAPTAAAPQTPMAIGMPWGVETLTKEERFAKGINAGIDQFGGVDDPGPLLAAAKSGKISTARIDEAVRRVMMQKFVLGLFDNPYVDAAAASRIVGDPASQAAADAAQRAAQVVLENRGALLPLPNTTKRVWLYGVSADAARAAGFSVAETPEQADVAIVRVKTPSEKLHPYNFFGGRQNEGRLDFRDGDADYEAIKSAAARVPTIVAVNVDRPPILTNVRDKARAVIVLFGASDAALLDVITGKAAPRGRLPFELPSSMAAVEAQDPSAPDDSANPLYKRGAGLRLSAKR